MKATAGAAAFALVTFASAAFALSERVVVVFDAPETGGASAPQPIFERELAFEARLEALAVGEAVTGEKTAYAERHVRSALDRHVATELLAHVAVEKPPGLAAHPCDAPSSGHGDDDLARRIELARTILVARVHGADALDEAAAAEHVGEEELSRLLRREALAARYLDVMVAPMLAPTDGELREIAKERSNPYFGRPFDESRCALRAWTIARRMATAVASFLQSSRGRVHVTKVAP